MEHIFQYTITNTKVGQFGVDETFLMPAPDLLPQEQELEGRVEKVGGISTQIYYSVNYLETEIHDQCVQGAYYGNPTGILVYTELRLETAKGMTDVLFLGIVHKEIEGHRVKFVSKNTVEHPRKHPLKMVRQTITDRDTDTIYKAIVSYIIVS